MIIINIGLAIVTSGFVLGILTVFIMLIGALVASRIPKRRNAPQLSGFEGEWYKEILNKN